MDSQESSSGKGKASSSKSNSKSNTSQSSSGKGKGSSKVTKRFMIQILMYLYGACDSHIVFYLRNQLHPQSSSSGKGKGSSSKSKSSEGSSSSGKGGSKVRTFNVEKWWTKYSSFSLRHVLSIDHALFYLSFNPQWKYPQSSSSGKGKGKGSRAI